MDVAECILDGNADAVEFCPHSSFSHVLAASTYTLQEGDQPSRSGSISIFNVNVEIGCLELLHRVETAGIFDIKWSPVGQTGSPLLAQADADGCLRIHALEYSSNGSEGEREHIRERCTSKVSSSMCLCLDWNSSASAISVGHSDGFISILSARESHLEVQNQWKAHEFELWATSFDSHQSHLVYTGSDDCKFSCWDLRDTPSKAFHNTKTHKMGVCCIAKSPSDPYKLLTGSYDEHLRVWDMRSISKPMNETSICLGGGVWKIKPHPSVFDVVLAACMHNGFAIVRVKDDDAEVVETYGKHGSLAYGADWKRGDSSQEDKRKRYAVATCSFYDRLLKIWIPETDI
ncbi:diphthine methyltransferase [Momordica charantia]|uniref:methylated diphthine methylhydrolase n=1 Tax=Momordica charantia TaxID=3673 RepID=A0A6J1C1D5_MOMCH|nr:diphthine methyltransferase [Momordica charantia]